MRLVVAIADRGSLTAAAEALDTSPPTVVRALAALERELGVRLFDRTTRRLSPTDEGREYAERCRRVLADVEEAEASVAAKQGEPSGTLRVTAPVMLGRLHVAPLVADFLAAHPRVRVELTLLDRTVDLIEEGLDLGVRVGVLPESSLVAVAVGQVRRVTCASPAYLRRAGTPRHPAELREHGCVSFTPLVSASAWEYVVSGRSHAFAVTSVLTTNQGDAALQACLRGLGCGAFLSYQVAGALKEGTLRRVLTEHEPPARPVSVVRPQGRLLPLRVRAFVDWMAPRLRARLPSEA